MSIRSFARTTAAIAVVVLLLPASAWSQTAKNGRLVPSAGAVSPQAVATPVDARCTATKLVVRATNSTDTFTSSLTFIPMSQMAMSINVPAASCVIVHFAAEVFAPFGRVLSVRARIDGAVVGTPSDVQLGGDDDEDNDGRWARSHAAIFVFRSVPAGAHTVRIEWKSSGGEVNVHHRTMLIQHP